jgi:hypothetical protein
MTTVILLYYYYYYLQVANEARISPHDSPRAAGTALSSSSERTVSVAWSRLGLLSGWCRCSLLVTR